MKLGIIGSGVVARTLGSGFLKHGHDVMLGTRSPSKLDDWLSRNSSGLAGSMSDAAAFGRVVVLAVKGTAAKDALRAAGAENLTGKVIIDTTNPIAEAPPQNGVLRFFTDLDRSLMEDLQQEYPQARFVKAFSCAGNALMVNPQLPGGPPTMFMCGNDEGAKQVVYGFLDQFGWEIEDLGTAEAARAIEPLCMLWCIPGFLNGGWMHAFKLLRA